MICYKENNDIPCECGCIYKHKIKVGKYTYFKCRDCFVKKRKEVSKKYRQSELGRKTTCKYRQSDNYKVSRKQYQKSENYKASRIKYKKSERFKEHSRLYFAKKEGGNGYAFRILKEIEKQDSLD